MIPHNQWWPPQIYGRFPEPDREVPMFEEELATAFRPGWRAACVANGTTALYLAMKALDYRPFHVTTYTCAAVVHAHRLAGLGEPELSDISSSTLHPEIRDVSEHTYGRLDRSPSMLEDFTHAPLLGVACLQGEAAVCSFGPTKPLPAGGGGAVFGPADLIDDVMDRRRYEVVRGDRFNWSMAPVLAAIGRESLKGLRTTTEARLEIAARYTAVLLNATDRVRVLTSALFPYRYVIEVLDRSADVVIDDLEALGVQAICPLTPNELLHRHVRRRDQESHAPLEFPNAEHAATALVSIPIWPGLGKRQVSLICRALEKVCAAK